MRKVYKTSCIPVNTTRELESLQSSGYKIMNVYPIIDSIGATAIHIIYKDPKKLNK